MQTAIFITFVARKYSPSAILNLRKEAADYPLVQSAQEAFPPAGQMVDANFRRRDIFRRKFTSRSELSPENIAPHENITSFRLNVPGCPKMLKDWRQMLVKKKNVS